MTTTQQPTTILPDIYNSKIEPTSEVLVDGQSWHWNDRMQPSAWCIRMASNTEPEAHVWYVQRAKDRAAAKKTAKVSSVGVEPTEAA